MANPVLSCLSSGVYDGCGLSIGVNDGSTQMCRLTVASVHIKNKP